MKQTINARVKILREHLGISQTEFGGKIEIGQVSVYKIEAGDNNPSDRTIRAMVKAFNVSTEWLKTGKGEMILPYSEEVVHSDPWRDALVKELKEEVNYLRELLKMSVGNKAGNFLKALDLAGDHRKAA